LDAALHAVPVIVQLPSIDDCAQPVAYPWAGAGLRRSMIASLSDGARRTSEQFRRGIACAPRPSGPRMTLHGMGGLQANERTAHRASLRQYPKYPAQSSGAPAIADGDSKFARPNGMRRTAFALTRPRAFIRNQRSGSCAVPARQRRRLCVILRLDGTPHFLVPRISGIANQPGRYDRGGRQFVRKNASAMPQDTPLRGETSPAPNNRYSRRFWSTCLMTQQPRINRTLPAPRSRILHPPQYSSVGPRMSTRLQSAWASRRRRIPSS